MWVAMATAGHDKVTGPLSRLAEPCASLIGGPVKMLKVNFQGHNDVKVFIFHG